MTELVEPEIVVPEIVEPPRQVPEARLRLVPTKNFGDIAIWMVKRLQPGGEIEWSVAFKDYWLWCTENKFDPYPGDQFGEKIEKLCALKGIDTRKRRQKVYLLGLGLRGSHLKASAS